MGNLGSGELLVIFFVALIVLGPNKLPEAARQVGRAVNELRRISGGFQREMREAMNAPAQAIADDDAARKAAAGPDPALPTPDQADPPLPSEDTPAESKGDAAADTDGDSDG